MTSHDINLMESGPHAPAFVLLRLGVQDSSPPPSRFGVSGAQDFLVSDNSSGGSRLTLREQSLRFVQRGHPLVAQLSVVDTQLGGTSQVAK